jgi:hypothetical protein
MNRTREKEREKQKKSQVHKISTKRICTQIFSRKKKAYNIDAFKKILEFLSISIYTHSK